MICCRQRQEARTEHAQEPFSAAETALSPYYVSPSHACWREKLLAAGNNRGVEERSGDILLLFLCLTPVVGFKGTF
jgi:hypothetical protein